MPKTAITRADIMPVEEYAKIRSDFRRRLTQMKRHRRLEIGPCATLYFENYETMWGQVQEMLHIGRGGERQIADELEAYGPLVPNGRELVATLMFEIADEERRRRFLAQLGGVENTVALIVGDEHVLGIPERDVERSTPDGKASSVHFLHFPFTDRQVTLFRDPATTVVASIGHPNYGHMAVMPPEVRNALAGDFA